jgi:ribonuclease J
MPSPTTITFLALGTPTGLKFAVAHGGHRALFEFGREHAPGASPFAQGIEPRPGRELADLLAVGVAPRVEGVYDGVDGRTSMFLSHLHLDHTGLVRHVHPDLPLYYPAAMEPLRAAAAASGQVPWREPAGTPLPDRGRVAVGEVEVELVAVDHDVPGAAGFVIRAPDVTIAYTGDNRRHGLHPELTGAYARAARGADVLIQEGVSLGWDGERECPSEADVHASFEEALAACAGLAVVNVYPMNRERVAAFGEACRRQGRALLMSPPDARTAGWPDVLDPDAVARARQDPVRHCVQLGFHALPALIDLAPPPGSLYVHSDGAPLGPFDPAYPVMRAWCAALGLRFVALSSSGHARPADVDLMVREIAPRVVLPVHTTAPDRLDVAGVPRVLVEPLRPYTPGDLLRAATAV